VLQDGLLENLTKENFDAVCKPKVIGTTTSLTKYMQVWFFGVNITSKTKYNIFCMFCCQCHWLNKPEHLA
jgi:hypothetical protein